MQQGLLYFVMHILSNSMTYIASTFLIGLWRLQLFSEQLVFLFYDISLCDSLRSIRENISLGLFHFLLCFVQSGEQCLYFLLFLLSDFFFLAGCCVWPSLIRDLWNRRRTSLTFFRTERTLLSWRLFSFKWWNTPANILKWTCTL